MTRAYTATLRHRSVHAHGSACAPRTTKASLALSTLLPGETTVSFFLVLAGVQRVSPQHSFAGCRQTTRTGKRERRAEYLQR